MSERFVCSDHHLSHENICKFVRRDGVTPLRPYDNADEMDEDLIKRHNSVVGKNDVVYFLGDVAINTNQLHLLDRMNGSKRLILGNHDKGQMGLYAKHFKKIQAYRTFPNDFIFSHIPLHPDSIGARFVTNVHGHTHADEVMWTPNHPKKFEVDPRYYCVCMENIDYTPISFDDLKSRIKKRQEDAHYVPPVKPPRIPNQKG